MFRRGLLTHRTICVPALVLPPTEKTITSGNIHVEVSFLGIKVINQDKDLCEAIAKYQPCPLNAGPQTAQVTQSLPSSAPSGHYTGKAKVTDQDGSEVACVNLDFNLN